MTVTCVIMLGSSYNFFKKIKRKLGQCSYTLVQLFKRYQNVLARSKEFCALGCYVIFTLICWLLMMIEELIRMQATWKNLWNIKSWITYVLHTKLNPVGALISYHTQRASIRHMKVPSLGIPFTSFTKLNYCTVDGIVILQLKVFLFVNFVTAMYHVWRKS